MQINLDLDLNYSSGLTYHSFIYFFCALVYMILGVSWTYRGYKKLQLAKSLPIYFGFGILICTILLQELISGVTVLVLELDFDTFPTVVLFASNLTFLWNVAYMYMLLMTACKGWCITKTKLTNTEKQLVICTDF